MIPILAKSDQFVPDELIQVKRSLIDRAKQLLVSFFDMEQTLNEIEEPELRQKLISECLDDHLLAPCPPFSVMNPSNIRISPTSKHKRLGREYQWGFADCLDPSNSDFSRLHKLLLIHLRSDLTRTID